MRNLSLGIALRRSLPLVFKQSRMSTCVKAAVVLFSGLVNGAMVPAMELFFTGLVGQDVGGAPPRIPIFFALGILVLIMMINAFMSIVMPVIEVYRQGRISGGLTYLIHRKMSSLSPQIFEDKEALDGITKAKEGMDGAMGLLDMVIQIVCYHGMYFTVVGVFLWRLQPALIISLTFVFIPVALSQIIHARIHAAQQNLLAPVRREEEQYYQHALDHEDARFYGLFNYFHAKMLNARKRLFAKEWQTEVRVQWITFGLNLVKILGWVGILTLLFRGMVGGTISVGAFAAVFMAIGMVFGSMEEVFKKLQDEGMNRLGAIHHFLHFLDMTDENKTVEPTPVAPSVNTQNTIVTSGITAENTVASNITATNTTTGGITAVNISFSYPGAERPAVRDVSLTITPGETIAIVGENGSGKTTLVKILCGLYAPDKGEVHHAANTTPYALTSAVFQDFAQYTPLSLAENVHIASWESTGDEINKGLASAGDDRSNRPASTVNDLSTRSASTEDKINDCLASAEVDYTDTATFPHGTDTILSRDLDGVQLSGGQWQRIAMARGMFRPHDIIVLDEPTAAIDPVEESRVYRQFADFAKDKTAILVTHRLGSARIADRIIIMDNGRIAETGTHDTLLAKGGLYANMWQMQAGGY